MHWSNRWYKAFRMHCKHGGAGFYTACGTFGQHEPRKLQSYLHRKDRTLTVSVLSEDTSGAVIGVLGFSTGKTGDKLANVRYKMLREGVPVIKENSCCWFLCKVIGRMETETHTVFLGQILAGSDRVEGTPMTYAYYQRVIKGTPSKNAPTYRLPGPDRAGNDGEAFLCQICKYEYNDPITPFAELPDDWVCPVCGSSKSVFARNGSNNKQKPSYASHCGLSQKAKRMAGVSISFRPAYGFVQCAPYWRERTRLCKRSSAFKNARRLEKQFR